MFQRGPLVKLASNPNASSYLSQSKAQNEYFIKEPEDHKSIVMNAILNERNNAEIHQQQEEMRKQAKINGKRNQKRIENVRVMQKDLREKFIESNGFIRECEQKEIDVNKKIDTEKAIQIDLQKQIDDLQMRIETLTEFHEDSLKPAISNMMPFENVLDEVIEQVELLKSKNDFLDRCDALLLAQTEVTTNDQLSLKLIEEMQADMVKTSNEASSIIAGLENQLNEIQKNYEKIKAEGLKWENVLASTKDVIFEKQKSIFMRFDQIQQLYLLFCKRNDVEPEFNRDQVEQQLDFIKNEMETIQEIIQLSNEMMSVETRSDIAEHGSGKSGKPRK